MAEDFQTGIFGENWWSSTIVGWSSDLGSIKDKAFNDSDSVSDASIVSHETLKAQNSESSTENGSIFVNSALRMMGSSFSSPTSDWNPNALNNHTGDLESNFNYLFEEEMDDKMINFHELQEITCKDSSIISFKTCVVEVDEELAPGRYGYPSTIFERLPEPETGREEGLSVNDFSINCSLTDDYEATQSLSKQKLSDRSYSGYQCDTNGAELDPSMEEKKKLYPINLQLLKKHESIEPESKRRRIEAPSPVPTFKVRFIGSSLERWREQPFSSNGSEREDGGPNNSTPLQQLVSPIGKIFSTPCLKTEHLDQNQQEAVEQDLERHGLCLVPICSTFPFVNKTTPSFWTPQDLSSGGKKKEIKFIFSDRFPGAQ